MEEVRQYAELLGDADGTGDFSMIVGTRDRRGREVLVKGQRQSLICVCCQATWSMRLVGVKSDVTGEVRIMLVGA